MTIYSIGLFLKILSSEILGKFYGLAKKSKQLISLIPKYNNSTTYVDNLLRYKVWYGILVRNQKKKMMKSDILYLL